MNTFELGSRALALTEHYGVGLGDMAGTTVTSGIEEHASITPGVLITGFGQFGGHSPVSEEHLQESANYRSEDHSPFGQYCDLSATSSTGHCVPPPYLNPASYQNPYELASNTGLTYYEPLNYHRAFCGGASTEMNTYCPSDGNFNYNMTNRKQHPNGLNSSDCISGYSGGNFCSPSRTAERCISTPPAPSYFAVNEDFSVTGGVCLSKNSPALSPRIKGRKKTNTITTASSFLDYKSQTCNKFRSSLFSEGALDMRLQEELKNEWRKHRNRVAALKCRERKLMRLESLQNKKSDLEAQCDDLSERKFALKSKVQSLARTLKAHQAAGCKSLNLPPYVNRLYRLS